MGIWFYIVFWVVVALIGFRWGRVHHYVGWTGAIVAAVFLANTVIGFFAMKIGTWIPDHTWEAANALYVSFHR